MHNLINIDRLMRMIENAYRDGFIAGSEPKAPPEQIAWLLYKQANQDSFTPLSKEELLTLEKWKM